MENTLYNRGEGDWKIITYNPPQEFGPYSGTLYRSKDDYSVKIKDDIYVCSFPIQNVAACININALENNHVV